MAIAHRDGFPDTDLRSLLSRHSFPLNEPISFEGCVVKESEARGEESLTTIEMNAFLKKDCWAVCNGNAILRIAEPDQGPVQGQTINLKRGDRVRGWATWSNPRNYENPGSADRVALLARRGIFLVGRVKSSRLLETLPDGCSNPWTRMATSISRRVQRSLEPIREKENGQPSAILASLVIGDYSQLDNKTREVFQNSGTFHVLIVSGLHVAWIAGLLLQFFKLILLPERVRYLLAALAILLYTCVVGFQASITRCLWMFLLYLVGRMLLRRADSLNVLLTSAIILLVVEPDWLFEAGFQLSFLSVIAIAMTAVPAINAHLKPLCEPLRHTGNPNRLFLQQGPWYRRGRNLRTRCEILIEGMTDSLPSAVCRVLLWICRIIAGTVLALGSMTVTSLSVQVWLEPLLAHYFNRMSWISPFANLAIVPLSSIVLSAGIIGSLAADLFCGPALIRLAGSLSSLLLSLTARITTFSCAWQRCPTPSPAWVLGGILLLTIWSFFEWRRFWIPCAYIGLMLACLSQGSVPLLGTLFGDSRFAVRDQKQEIWKRNAPILSFTFLDVGEGDSIVISFPDRQLWVLDAGGIRQALSLEDNTYAFDIGEAVVSRYLWHEWATRLDRVILSHTDLDHAGGIPAILKNFRVARLDYSQAGADAILSGILNIAREKTINTKVLHAGLEERIGPVHVRTLNPPADSKLGSTNENSLVLEFSYMRFSALLTGDLEKSGESEILSQPGSLHSQLLKVAHHGSRWGTSNLLLDRTKPRWAVVSVGRNNPFGHPSRETILRLLRHGARPILTFDTGAVTFETDGVRYSIKSHVSGILERGDL